MRIALVLSYDGTDFYGSQIQKSNHPTVLGTLQHILEQLNITSPVIASGRTDKGVHATYQVCHLDLPAFWDDTDKLKRVLNTMVPKSLHVKKIFRVSENFHARYSAIKRTYRYIISTKETNPFESRYVTFLPSCDFTTIQQNITLFQGEYDFRYFEKTGSDTTTTIRTVYKAFAYTHKSYIILHYEANGFLRSQIRLMVGALLNLKRQQIIEMLQTTHKYKIKPVPPNGLYLAKIKYQEKIC